MGKLILLLFWGDGRKGGKGMTRFLRAALIRAGRTAAQTMAATLGTCALLSEVDWRQAVSAAALSALLSVLTSLATGLPEAE